MTMTSPIANAVEVERSSPPTFGSPLTAPIVLATFRSAGARATIGPFDTKTSDEGPFVAPALSGEIEHDGSRVKHTGWEANP